MSQLPNNFCPHVHEGPITAVAYDPSSGVVATADKTGVVAVTRRGETTPGLIFTPGGPIQGALSLIRGGTLLAVGDDYGSVGVYKTDSGTPVFQEFRELPGGAVRAMRAVCLSPTGEKLASIAVDGLLRLWDISQKERITAWRGFGGAALAFDRDGDRLLCLNEKGQPCLADLKTQSAIALDSLKHPAENAIFTRSNTHIVCAGPSGISLLRVADGKACASFAAKGGSGIVGVTISPDDTQVAVLTKRSVHSFYLPDLSPNYSKKHGAPLPSGYSYWGTNGLKIAGSDGRLHQVGQVASLGRVSGAAAFGQHTVVAHDEAITFWTGGKRDNVVTLGEQTKGLSMERGGKIAAVFTTQSPLRVFAPPSETPIFTADDDTIDPQSVSVGGHVVAVMLKGGGVRWWDLSSRKGFKFSWAKGMALSGSGAWLAVITPNGGVRVVDTSTGTDIFEAPTPLADLPIVRLCFVNRKPELLVLDRDGVLGRYDLSESLTTGESPEGEDVLELECKVSGMWGITGGRYAAIRLPENDLCSIIVVDVEKCAVVVELPNLHPQTTVNPETGAIIEPVKAGGLLERDITGKEIRVFRSLPGQEWITYGERGIEFASDGAGSAI
jgi:WD40 repeat protein